jgi:ribonuclease G
MDEILLNIESKEIRSAHMKNSQLHDLSIARKQDRLQPGNIYRGKVKNLLRNIQSAFIDINEGENGFIHVSDILENTQKFEQIYDMDFDLDFDINALENPAKQQNLNIDQLMKTDQAVLVQVVKEPIGNKGARLTSNISIAGRYLVLLPNSSHRGVSRKIEDRSARDKLKRLIRSFEMPKEMGLICRTASATASEEQLIAEAHELLRIWQNIIEKFNNCSDPCLLYAESDIVQRALLTAVNKKVDRLLVDDYTIYQSCKQRYSHYSKEHPLKSEYYRDKLPIFERFNVEKEIDKAMRRKIWLPSGGYLFFERTEAMHTIDVNSGRSSGAKGDVEESLLRINMEAAEEIAKQVRIRNIGGLIICDFIDMRQRKNERRLLERLKDCMKEDSAKCTILGMNEFGVVIMTRQRNKGSLHQLMFCGCGYCNNSGLIKTHESISIEIERELKKAINFYEQYALKLVVHPELEKYMHPVDRPYLNKMVQERRAQLQWEVDDRLHINDFHIYSTVTNKRIGA